MASAYERPGVYIEEMNTGARPIQAVGTSTAGFVGEAPSKSAEKGNAVGIANWTQFLKKYGNWGADGLKEDWSSNSLAMGVRGFFANGGSYCFVVNAKLKDGLKELERIDQVAIVAAPGQHGSAAWKALIDHCSKRTMQDRVAILDPIGKSKNIENLTRSGPGSGTPAVAGERPEDSTYAAFYYPNVEVSNPHAKKADGSDARLIVSPSGYMAGAWARVDANRGVHKAPANIGLGGVLGLEHYLSRSEQELLNPKGVNCIRSFSDRGILVWGARTVADPSSEYRYLPVRRLMNQIKESIEEGTRWVVFEPNNESLWASIRRDVGAFLRGMWRAGALRGASESEAFFVQCDAETNPPDSIDAGKVVIKIGVSPVKPAEFVIFQIGQLSATS